MTGVQTCALPISIMEFEMQRMAAGAMSIHTTRISAHTTGTRTAVGTRENL